MQNTATNAEKVNLFDAGPSILVVLLASSPRISLRSRCFHPTTTINVEINLSLPQRNV